VILLAGALSFAAAGPPSELVDLLARPISPGSIALLAEHTGQPGVPDRLQTAMSDPNPRVRAAAARVAHVGFVKGLTAPIRQALGAETDADAAREQIRALAALAPPSDDPALRQAATRFGGRLDFALLEALARTRQAGVVDLVLDPSSSFAVSRAQEAEVVLLGARLTPEAVVRYANALLSRADLDRWGAFLAVADSRRVPLPEMLLAAGVRSRVSEIAGRTAWRLAQARAAGEGTGTNVLDGVATPESSDPDVPFAFEVARRTAGQPFEEDAAWISSLEDLSRKTLADSILPNDPVLSLLSKPERDAVRRRWERRNAGRGARSGEPRPAKEGAFDEYAVRAFEAESLALRGVTDLPRGVAEDAIAVSGCRPRKDGLFGGAAMRYNVEGRPLRVTPIDVSVSKRCETASRNLCLLTLAPRSALPIRQRPEILVAFARKDCIGELDEEPVPPAGSRIEESAIYRAGADVESPVLITRVEPDYPEDIRRAGLEGVVVLEAVITESGCVRAVSVVKGVAPPLDFQSARAVSQWRYRPARLEGRPVRVYLTVTVTFRLHSRR
jgi:TonB family protein